MQVHDPREHAFDREYEKIVARDRLISRLTFACTALLLLVAVLGLLLFMVTRSQAATECQSDHDSRTYWSWRSIEGRKCWYRGHRVLAKSELYWPEKEKKPEKKPEKKIKTDPVSTIRAEDTGLPAPKIRAPLQSNQPMEIVTDGCCWPQLTEFELLWDKIMQALKWAAKGSYDETNQRP